MLNKTFLGLTLLVSLLLGCSENTSVVVDAEPALAILGGAIMGSQGTGVTAMHKRRDEKMKAVERFIEALNPIHEAWALRSATACGDMTTVGVCTGTGNKTLIFRYQDCQPSGITRSGYWHSYVSYAFPTAGDCTNALTTGFGPGTVAGLVGKTFTRDWGQSHDGSFDYDENNIRVGADGTVNFFYGKFPSGWQEVRSGGVDIKFETLTRRRIVIKGVHAVGLRFDEDPVPNPSSFDLSTLPTDGSTVHHIADHTINTIKTGDALFEVGPTVSFDGSNVTFGTTGPDIAAEYDGDAVVNVDTVAAGATFRVQHNITQSVGVLAVTQPLVYSDTNCCWPMSGKMKSQYDRNLKSPTLEEEITFTGAGCGTITYTTTLIDNQPITLSQCF